MEFLSKVFVCVFLANTFAVLCLGKAAFDLAESGMTQKEFDLLEQSVKAIVDPKATTDLALFKYALSQGGYPKTFSQMMTYIPYYVSIARSFGIQADDLKDTILRKAAQWIDKNHPALMPQVDDWY